MGLTAAQKIIKEHLVEGELESGTEIAIKIDQTLTQDATGTMVYLQFESIDIPRVKTELSVSYVDHNTLQGDFRNMDDHLYLQTVAAKYGIHFSRPGNGICHQVHLEGFGKPGKTLLGSDSHTPTGGGLGMIAIGAGGLDVAAAMAGMPFHLTMPEIIGVKLSGQLRPGISAKDIILEVLRRESVKGGVGKIYEYFGPGLQNLSVPERATITNMGAELGATTSVFPSDLQTKHFLKQMEREEDWKEITADEDAEFSRNIEIDLNKLEALVACPHMPDQVVEVKSLEGKKVDQVAIGSCTNSSINDLGAAASILKNKTIAENLSLGISPGSRQTFLAAEKCGIISDLLASGARILESACGPCIGMGFAPCSKGVSLRTFNRNFKGRSGTADAEIYLVSPETAAAAALTGSFTDPTKYYQENRKDYFDQIKADKSMIISPPPAQEAEKIEIRRGPNIKPCPSAKAVDSTIKAISVLKTGDNITTDDIMPAGAKILPLRSNIPEISKHVFAAIDNDFYERALKSDELVIIGGENYGQGSSREHAALAPMYLGVRIVLAKSFARIHKANLCNFGIIPLVFDDPADYDKIDLNDILSFPEAKKQMLSGNTVNLFNNTKNCKIKAKHDLGQRSLEILLAGGLLNLAKKKS